MSKKGLDNITLPVYKEVMKEVPGVAKETIEGATSGTIDKVLGLDSNGNIVKGNVSSGDISFTSTSYLEGSDSYCKLVFSPKNVVINSIDVELSDGNDNYSIGIWLSVVNAGFAQMVSRDLSGDDKISMTFYYFNSNDTEENYILLCVPNSSALLTIDDIPNFTFIKFSGVITVLD